MSDMKIYNYTIPYLSLVFYYFLLITYLIFLNTTTLLLQLHVYHYIV